MGAIDDARALQNTLSDFVSCEQSVTHELSSLFWALHCAVGPRRALTGFMPAMRLIFRFTTQWNHGVEQSSVGLHLRSKKRIAAFRYHQESH